MNPWHDMDPGDDPGRLCHCVIEVPSGSKNKYELDKSTGLLRLDRVLYSSVHYPANYGFIPRTYCGDGDPLDVLVLCQEPVEPLCIVRARPIGMISMSDDKGQDDKIIAVAVDDPQYAETRDVAGLPAHRLREIKQFFADYKLLEDKVSRVGPLKRAAAARRAIREAVRLYAREIFPSLPPPSPAGPGTGR